MKLLFICTGNTCRSPMAEGIFRDMMRKAGWEEQILCQSAGLSPSEGEPAARNAVLACREIGVDISDHTARRLKGRELPMWDVFFPMTRTHGYILEQAGVPSHKIYLPQDVDDPFGQDLETYRRCRDALCRELERFRKEHLEPLLSSGDPERF